MPTIFAILSAISTVVLWYALVRSVPSNLLSLFRYKLWALRDDIADDIARGRLPEAEPAQELLRICEAVIAFAPSVTFPTLVVLPRPSSEFLASEERTRQVVSLWEPAEANRYHEHKRRLYRAISLQLLIGGPGGWVTLPFAVLRTLWILFRNRRQILELVRARAKELRREQPQESLLAQAKEAALNRPEESERKLLTAALERRQVSHGSLASLVR